MNEIQIPKLIHYCWFGKKELPPLVKKCIISWKKHLPDYEFKLWNEENFDINSNEWCKSAYLAKKYAFVADYCRLIKLYEYGGVYLEAVLISFDKFVKHDLDECNLYHSFCGFSKEFIIDGQPSEVFQP